MGSETNHHTLQQDDMLRQAMMKRKTLTKTPVKILEVLERKGFKNSRKDFFWVPPGGTVVQHIRILGRGRFKHRAMVIDLENDSVTASAFQSLSDSQVEKIVGCFPGAAVAGWLTVASPYREWFPSWSLCLTPGGLNKVFNRLASSRGNLSAQDF